MSKTTKALAILGVVAGLGVAAMPMGAMAATTVPGSEGDASGTVTVKTTIEDTLSLTIAGNDSTSGEAVLIGTSGKMLNDSTEHGDATITVATNHFGGYKVNIKGAAGGFKGTDTDEVFAAVSTSGVAQFPTNASSFGYKTSKGEVANLTLPGNSEGEKWYGLSESDATIATGAAATGTEGDSFTITFQAYADASQAADTYSQLVTITATTNLD